MNKVDKEFKPSVWAIGKSNIIYFETDCKKFKTRFLRDMYFEEHMGMGKSETLSEFGEWITIQKNSIGEYFNNFICSIKK